MKLLEVNGVSKSFGGVTRWPASRAIRLEGDPGNHRSQRFGENYLRQRRQRSPPDRQRHVDLRRGEYRAHAPPPVGRGRAMPHLSGGPGVFRAVRSPEYRGCAFAVGEQGTRPAEIRELAEWLRLDRKLDKPAGSLTLFEQRRLELLMRLVLKPRLIMLDEPVGGLAVTEVVK